MPRSGEPAPGPAGFRTRRRPPSGAARRAGRLAALAALAALAGLMVSCSRAGDAVERAAAPSTSAIRPPPSVSGSASTATSAVPRRSPARFEEAGCRFEVPEGYEVRCGYLVVPQDRSRPDGLEVRLHVGVFSAPGKPRQGPPLLYLEGGPGGNALKGVSLSFDDRFGPLAAERDVVVFDQRGTGYSEPLLDCPALTALLYDQLDQVAPNAVHLAAQQELLPGCAADLHARGVDLAQYNSVASAADVADLRRALGIASWDIYGLSYGTRLAQTLLRTHPEGVRSVVLDSTYPVAVDSLVELPAQTRAAVDRFFAGCRADPACAGRYPDLDARFEALAARLDAQPVAVTAADLVEGGQHPAVVAGTDLRELLFQSLYDPVLFSAFPQVVEDLEQGRVDSLTALASVAVTQLPFLTLGAHLAVQCHEEVAFADPAAVLGAAAAQPGLAEQLAGQIVEGTAGFETCRRWPSGRAGPEENQPVRSDLPTLILSGGYDPITPSAWGREVARLLSRSTFVVFPPLGHGVGFTPGCPREIVRAFLAEPTAPVDTSCAARMPPPPFTAPAEPIAVTLEDFVAEMGGVVITGRQPADWVSAGPGTVARQRNLVDPTALAQQAVPRVDPDALVELLAGQLPLQGELVEAAAIDAGGLTWRSYRGRLADHLIDVHVGARDGTTLVVLLTSTADERDALVREVLQPALGALRRER